MPSAGFRTISIRTETYKQAIDLAARLTLQNEERVTVSEGISRAIEHYKKHLETIKDDK